jgi:Uma2 family endonuclease
MRVSTRIPISSLPAIPTFWTHLSDTLLDPIVIVEVMSPSTEAYDRVENFELYRPLESLRDYVLIASSAFRWSISRVSQMANGF